MPPTAANKSSTSPPINDQVNDPISNQLSDQLNGPISTLVLALLQLLNRADGLLARLEQQLPAATANALADTDWLAASAFRYRTGLSTQGTGRLVPVRHIGSMGFADLKEIDTQKEKIRLNTQQFVQGLPANNVLLTGARGTGKSSLIKACLNEFAAQGLRLIEVGKSDLVDLPEILDVLLTRPEKFIIYCDDLSFDAGESGYKELKSTLDGSIAATAPNVLIYATSNRRHLLPNYMQDNLEHNGYAQTGEVHPGEVVEEKISLSERFGLWISFYPFSQDEYWCICQQWLNAMGLQAAQISAAKPAALMWALERAARSGRVAYQFARHYAAQQHNGQANK